MGIEVRDLIENENEKVSSFHQERRTREKVYVVKERKRVRRVYGHVVGSDTDAFRLFSVERIKGIERNG